MGPLTRQLTWSNKILLQPHSKCYRVLNGNYVDLGRKIDIFLNRNVIDGSVTFTPFVTHSVEITQRIFG
jgi:hypothetical protein